MIIESLRSLSHWQVWLWGPYQSKCLVAGAKVNCMALACAFQNLCHRFNWFFIIAHLMSMTSAVNDTVTVTHSLRWNAAQLATTQVSQSVSQSVTVSFFFKFLSFKLSFKPQTKVFARRLMTYAARSHLICKKIYIAIAINTVLLYHHVYHHRETVSNQSNQSIN